MERRRPGAPRLVTAGAPRAAAVRAGIYVEAFSVAWMILEAALSIGAGIAAGSVLLVAFGVDSVLELVTGGTVLWRLAVEDRGGDVARTERAERRAAGVTGTALALLCAYVLVTAVAGLATRRQPERTPLGIAVSAAAVVVMPALAAAKRRIAARLGSGALRGDAASSLTCGYMAGTVLAGLAASAALHWWWAEHVAALVFLYWLAGEAREALEEARRGERG